MNRTSQRYLDSDAVREHLAALKALPLSHPKGRLLAEVVAAVALEAASAPHGARAFYDRALPLAERAFALADLESDFGPRPQAPLIEIDWRGAKRGAVGSE